MDLTLPDIDGREATRRIKADPATKCIPVIALTAHAMAGDRQRFLHAGMDGYVSKPIHSQELMETIESVLIGLGA